MVTTISSFRELHKSMSPLKLPNAWDAGSARLFESLGAAAIATTSAGVAWALGYADGRRLPMIDTVGAAARMARVLSVPLSVDVENGYSDDPRTVSENVMRLVDLGVAGINIEDGTDEPSLLAAKIDAIRNSVSKSGADLFVNARCDVFLAGLVENSKRIGESVTRGKLYAMSGADGVFLPGIAEPSAIKSVVAELSLPLNVMAWPGLANATDLGHLGVRRLSAGSGISQVLWGRAGSLAKDFLETDHLSLSDESAMSYARLQQLFDRP